MRHYFIHQSRWLFLFVLLTGPQVLATPCKNCGKESEPGKDGQMFCQTCNSLKFTSPPPSPSSSDNESLKNFAARKNATETINSITPSPKVAPSSYSISLSKGKNDDELMAQIRVNDMARIHVSDMVVDGDVREDSDAFTKVLAKVIAQDLMEIDENMKVSHLKVKLEESHHLQKLLKMVEQQLKQLKMLQKSQKLYHAQLNAGALKTQKMPIHEKLIALNHERAAKIASSQWPSLSDMRMTNLLSAEFQNSQLMMDLTSVFQAIQGGNMIQLLITQSVAADEGSQAAAGTVTPMILGFIIPDPAMDGHKESTDMHLLTGTRPVQVNQDNLKNVLTDMMKALGENKHNAHLSLHFFLSPPTYLHDNEDPLPSTFNIENSINLNPSLGGFAFDKVF